MSKITFQSAENSPESLDHLECPESGLRVKISRKGAEMISLACQNADGDWCGFLYRDGLTEKPKSGWGNHATVMGYFLHRLVGERTTYRGTEIRGGNHGFLRGFEFSAPKFDAAAGSLTYHVNPAAIPDGAYPLRVALDLTYQLVDTRLQVTFHFENFEPALDAHVSFGLHPGFAVASVDNCEVLLPAGTYKRYWAPDNFLDGRVDEISFDGGSMPFSKTDLPGSYLLELAGVPNREITLVDRAGGRQVELDFLEVPYLTLWSDLGPMVCIEPCWGLPDSEPQKPFEEKIGIQVIPPLGTLTRSFSITPSLL